MADFSNAVGIANSSVVPSRGKARGKGISGVSFQVLRILRSAYQSGPDAAREQARVESVV